MDHLPIEDLSERHAGLTLALAALYHEAARVCLDRHHEPPAEIQIRNRHRGLRAITNWEETDGRTRAAWGNEVDATEAGAYACALAAVELCEGLFAVRRAETGTGADYYIAPAGQGIEDLEDCLRFEISGLDRGPTSAVSKRLKAKLEQAKGGNSNLPAMAGVVGFEARLILLQRIGS
jgi:hypothetical protein